MKGAMNLNKEIVEGMYIALIFIAGYYLVKTKRINILWKILAAVNILSWACLFVILALDINVSADFISLNLAACMSLAIFTPIIWFSNRKNMDIKILGSGCSRCKKTYETVKRVVEEDQVEGTVEYVTDIAKILDYDIMSMPAIVIDGKVVLNGQVPTADKVRELLEGEKKK